MNITALIDLIKEVLNSKDSSTKRIAAGLTALYALAQIPQVHDYILAFASTHQAGLEGIIVGVVITALFKSPNKGILPASSPDASAPAQEEKADAAQAGKP